MEKGIITMAEKITSITTDQNEIVSSIQKLSPKAGDVLMFYVKTDDDGIPIIGLDKVQQTAEMLRNTLEGNGVTGLFLMDKICLFSIDDADTVIKRLENCISNIRKAVNKVPDIENGNFRDSVTIEMKDAQDQSKRVL